MKNEIWKDIEGYKGLYQVSNFGRIRSLKFGKIKYLKQSKSHEGYLYVTLCIIGIKKLEYMHKIVAKTFLNHVPNRYNIVVDHIDNDKLNNRLNNIQLITNRQNLSKDQFRRNKTSQYIGVCWDKSRNKWIATIYLNNKHKNLGRFINEHDAHMAYQNKLNEIL